MSNPKPKKESNECPQWGNIEAISYRGVIYTTNKEGKFVDSQGNQFKGVQ